jgi:hypothetical protein
MFRLFCFKHSLRFLFSGSTANILIFGFIDLAYIDIPEIRPPPET